MILIYYISVKGIRIFPLFTAGRPVSLIYTHGSNVVQAMGYGTDFQKLLLGS